MITKSTNNTVTVSPLASSLVEHILKLLIQVLLRVERVLPDRNCVHIVERKTPLGQRHVHLVQASSKE